MGDSAGTAGVLCGTWLGRKTAAHRSYSRQSKKDLAMRYFGSSFASSLASFRSWLVGCAGVGISFSSSTSVSDASPLVTSSRLAKELRSSAALGTLRQTEVGASGRFCVPFRSKVETSLVAGKYSLLELYLQLCLLLT